MNKAGLNGSAIYHGIALSPVALATPGSTTPQDLSNYGWLNVVVAADSADLQVYIQRSATSNGTFSGTGLSIPSTASGLSVRGMPLESSAPWVRAAYTNQDEGSIIATIVFEAAGARRVPITQQATVVNVYSDVIP